MRLLGSCSYRVPFYLEFSLGRLDLLQKPFVTVPGASASCSARRGRSHAHIVCLWEGMKVSERRLNKRHGGGVLWKAACLNPSCLRVWGAAVESLRACLSLPGAGAGAVGGLASVSDDPALIAL